ncbi:hypothetical protein D3C86_1582360 [compost metagenome]
MLTNPATQTETVFVRQHHIEDHQVTGLVVQGLAETGAIGRGTHLKPGAGQVGVQQLAYLLIVIDQQNRLVD